LTSITSSSITMIYCTSIASPFSHSFAYLHIFQLAALQHLLNCWFPPWPALWANNSGAPAPPAVV